MDGAYVRPRVRNKDQTVVRGKIKRARKGKKKRERANWWAGGCGKKHLKIIDKEYKPKSFEEKEDTTKSKENTDFGFGPLEKLV